MLPMAIQFQARLGYGCYAGRGRGAMPSPTISWRTGAGAILRKIRRPRAYLPSGKSIFATATSEPVLLRQQVRHNVPCRHQPVGPAKRVVQLAGRIDP